MCDTLVALGNSTLSGKTLFAKNSDREPNEASEIVILPRAKHAPGEKVKCTYIEIPQVAETFQILLAKPFWIWGAEMGSNEFGVTIGNEAVFTREPYGQEPGLIGMDLLRLALERSKTADEALKVITDLLEQYGQSGNCGFAHKMYYHNSFIICDPDKAWVLETSGKQWAAEIVKDVRSISNAITIDRHWDLASENLVNHAIDNGWCKTAADFSFSECYSEPVYTKFSDAHSRQTCTMSQLSLKKGNLTPSDLMEFLRHHDGQENPDWSPDKGITGADVCMHAGWGPIRGSQSAGSMVSLVDRSDTVHWLTGTAGPCTSLFKPVWMDCGVPEHGSSPRGIFDESTLFWAHERIHRAILKNYPARIKLIRKDQADYESAMLKEVAQHLDASLNRRKEISTRFFNLAGTLEKKWATIDWQSTGKKRLSWLYVKAWKKFDREAGMKLE